MMVLLFCGVLKSWSFFFSLCLTFFTHHFFVVNPNCLISIDFNNSVFSILLIYLSTWLDVSSKQFVYNIWISHFITMLHYKKLQPNVFFTNDMGMCLVMLIFQCNLFLNVLLLLCHKF
jgi:NO-binding membrane sensor protein with MHYT domain